MKHKSELTAIDLKSMPAVMAAAARLEVEIREETSPHVLKALIALAAGAHDSMKRRWGPCSEAANRYGALWAFAEIRRIREVEALNTAGLLSKGTRGQIKGKQAGTGKGKGKGRSTGRAAVAPPVETAPTMADLGISKREAARARKLDELEKTGACGQLADELRNEGKPVNPNSILAKQRANNKSRKKQQIVNAAFSAEGPFDVVVIDPPWPMQKIDRDERPNQDAFPYPVMTEQQLAEFWPNDLAGKLNPDLHVFCWTTQRFLPAAFRLIEAWKLRYVFIMVWHKAGGLQPHGLPQYNCEFVVYARRGAPLFVSTENFPCCFFGERREHSRKPVEFYDLVRRVTGGSRVDVFAREQHAGFASFGNEPDKFNRVA